MIIALAVVQILTKIREKEKLFLRKSNLSRAIAELDLKIARVDLKVPSTSSIVKKMDSESKIYEI